MRWRNWDEIVEYGGRLAFCRTPWLSYRRSNKFRRSALPKFVREFPRQLQRVLCGNSNERV